MVPKIPDRAVLSANGYFYAGVEGTRRLPRGGRPLLTRTSLLRSWVGMLGFLVFAFSPIAEGTSRGGAQQVRAEGAIPQVEALGPGAPVPRTTPGSSRKQLEAVVARTAERYGVERALVLAVIAAESGYDSRAVSRAGAVGLMQLMPATAADYGVSTSEALFDPETNIRTGVRHLKRLLNKYKND